MYLSVISCSFLSSVLHDHETIFISIFYENRIIRAYLFLSYDYTIVK